MNAHHDVLPEGEEPPPRGVKLMAVVRWAMILALAAAAFWAFSITRQQAEETHLHAASDMWQCPMHPQVIQDHPGECPICHMTLMKVEKVVVEEMWQCPMHPQVTSDHAGQCPICHMDLVKVAKPSSHAGHEGLPELATVSLADDRVQRFGVKTEVVRKAPLDGTLEATGVLGVNESNTVRIHARFNGWVEELFVRETGAPVKKGEKLARIYSPEILQAQQEYVSSLSIAGGDALGEQVRHAAVERLRVLGVDHEPLDALPKGTRPNGSVTLLAPQDGVITQKGAVQGAYVSPGSALFEIADLSTVWMVVDVRGVDLPRVHVDQKARVRLQAFPDLNVTGRLAYLYPAMDQATQTVKARIELANPGRKLRPGMFGSVELVTSSGSVVVAPVDAVIQTGKRAYVFVEREPGVFEPRKVETGATSNGLIQLRSGVEDGEKLVTGALFMVDSESRLKATAQRVSQPGDAP